MLRAKYASTFRVKSNLHPLLNTKGQRFKRSLCSARSRRLSHLQVMRPPPTAPRHSLLSATPRRTPPSIMAALRQRARQRAVAPNGPSRQRAPRRWGGTDARPARPQQAALTPIRAAAFSPLRPRRASRHVAEARCCCRGGERRIGRLSALLSLQPLAAQAAHCESARARTLACAPSRGLPPSRAALRAASAR